MCCVYVYVHIVRIDRVTSASTSTVYDDNSSSSSTEEFNPDTFNPDAFEINSQDMGDMSDNQDAVVRIHDSEDEEEDVNQAMINDINQVQNRGDDINNGEPMNVAGNGDGGSNGDPIPNAVNGVNQPNDVNRMRDMGVQANGSILNCPRMLQTMNYQYASFLQSHQIMRNTFAMLEPVQQPHHTRMMMMIDLHFLNNERTTNIDPILFNYVVRCMPNIFSYGCLDQLRMFFLCIEMQRIVLEIHTQQVMARPIVNRQLACLLCQLGVGNGILFRTCTFGHVYCDACFNGIINLGTNTLCAFDHRLDLTVNANVVSLRVVLNGVNRAVCSMCEAPFSSTDSENGGIFAIRPCGHLFHHRCVQTQVYQCGNCATLITGARIRLNPSFE